MLKLAELSHFLKILALSKNYFRSKTRTKQTKFSISQAQKMTKSGLHATSFGVKEMAKTDDTLNLTLPIYYNSSHRVECQTLECGE